MRSGIIQLPRDQNSKIGRSPTPRQSSEDSDKRVGLTHHLTVEALESRIVLHRLSTAELEYRRLLYISEEAARSFTGHRRAELKLPL